ncbi:MAG TPA: hypothetical protein VGA56_06150 [Opitutaceae bacterium]
MFVEFEPIYRLLDVPEEADADFVRKVFAERLEILESQKKSAGSKPERMIAAKAISEFKTHEADAERLAAALEAKALLAEVASALAESKAAKASRALKNARAAAEKSGLRSLTEAVAEAEDSLADSGLVRDPAFDAEVEDLVSKLATLEAAVSSPLETGGAPPSDLIASVGVLEGRRAALLARSGARKDDEIRRLLEEMTPRFAALRTACEERAKEFAQERAVAELRGARQKLSAAAPIERLERIDIATLRATLEALEKLIAAPPTASASGTPAFETELSALKVHVDVIRSALLRREAMAVLDALEVELGAGPLSSGLAARIAEVEQLCQNAGVETAPARIAAIREQIARRAKPPPLPKSVPATPEPPKPPPAPPISRERKPAPPPQPPPQPPPDDLPSDVTIPFVPQAVAPEPAAVSRFTLVGPKGERCHVVSANPVVFGRSSGSNVAIRAFHPSNQREADRVTRAVSRAHFMIAQAGENIEVIDGSRQPDGTIQRSVNGTFDGDGNEIESKVFSGERNARIRVTREAEPAIPPSWEVRMQRRATLGTALGELRDANPAGPDCVLLRRADGSRHDVFLLWRAANLRELGLSADEAVIVRHKGGFLLWEGGRLMEIEPGFRIGGLWQVAKMGELSYGD